MLGQGETLCSGSCRDRTFWRHVGGGAPVERVGVELSAQETREGQVPEEGTLQ